MAVCRELTKLYEEVVRGTAAELAEWAAAGVRGELVVVVEGAPAAQITFPDAVTQVLELVRAGTRLKDAAGGGLGAHRALLAGAVPGGARRQGLTATHVRGAASARLRIEGMPTGESFYITTPIYYPSDVPHIGHGYTTVAVDALARWHRQAGDDTWMLTGTDEHGQKMLRAAAANGATPQEWVDRLVSEAWFPLLKTLDVANDDFIRTTQQRHEERVQKFVQAIYDRGYIYAGEFEALYCVGCEEFKTESEIVDGTGPFEGLKVCAIHSKPLELLQEKNYFFKLSEFQGKLLELYKTDFVRPESARNEVVSFVKQGLKDLSISRSTFDWGIPVPWDQSHIIYVWVDALLNYATAVGYGAEPEEFARRWPAYHVVGKDILRFHAVIWPAMLMAAGVEVPRGVFAHGWLLVGGEKMSKSKLTGIAPSEITDVFGSDAYRFYFLSAIAFGQDGSFSWEDLSARYQAELANGFGNLASRTTAMIDRYFEGIVPPGGRVHRAGSGDPQDGGGCRDRGRRSDRAVPHR